MGGCGWGIHNEINSFMFFIHDQKHQAFHFSNLGIYIELKLPFMTTLKSIGNLQGGGPKQLLTVEEVQDVSY